MRDLIRMRPWQPLVITRLAQTSVENTRRRRGRRRVMGITTWPTMSTILIGTEIVLMKVSVISPAKGKLLSRLNGDFPSQNLPRMTLLETL